MVSALIVLPPLFWSRLLSASLVPWCFHPPSKNYRIRGKSKTVAGMVGGIAGAVFCLWLLHDDMVFPTLLSAFVGGYVFAATLRL